MMMQASNTTMNNNSTLTTSTNQSTNQFPNPLPSVDGLCHNWTTSQPPYNNNNNNGEHAMQEKTNLDPLLQLMGQVSMSIKAGDFSTQLADNIFILCQQLKIYGQLLEQTHKNDLNKIFVSLRQACCRDNGQLGTPCRLKMMEMVELRAMGWRPNYSHTQYYLNRPEQSNNASSTGPKMAHTPSNPTPTQLNPPNFNAPPFIPSSNAPPPAMNYSVPPPPAPPTLANQSQYMFMPAEAPPPQPPPAPGYFLIPASGGWPNQMLPTPFMPPSPHMQMGLQRGAAPPLISPDSDWQMAAYLQNAALLNKQSSLMGSPLLGAIRHLNGRMDTTTSTTTNNKSNKSQQFREEMTIRNCDSGKIMGVKGRRVDLVEKLSKTVISFQKVETKSKERVLTITGNTEESIQQARLLIEDTIRRNISPTRILLGSEVAGNEEDEEEDDPGISIETSKDGTLKLCCADPEVLQAAQAALSEYLNKAHRTSRMSAEERELRKERRKSMPLQPTTPSVTKPTESVAPSKDLVESKRSLTGSTPNLLAGTTEAMTPTKLDNKKDAKVPDSKVLKYDRSSMLALCHNSIGEYGQAEALAKVKESMPEIVRESE